MKNILTVAIILILSLFKGTRLMYGQISWTKDAGNRVLRRDTVVSDFPNDIIAISDCWVAKEGTSYKMWYTCGGLNYPTDTLLRSRLCYATSLDGINWIKYSGNPILDVSYTGGWDSLGVETATVIIDSIAPTAERYKMWYAGQYFNSYRYDIGYAFSSDGINWTKHASPVIQVGSTSEWDNGFLEGPSVMKEGSIYKMWHCGYDVSVDGSGTDGHTNIGYATSTDGINWTKYIDNPVLRTGADTWDSINVQDPHVIKQGSMYYMWYGGGSSTSNYDQQVGFAYSSDGISWTKSTYNPVLAKGAPGQWDANTASFPSVVNDDGVLKMWYTGKDVDPPPANSFNYYWELGYATAPTTGISETGNTQNILINLFPNPGNGVFQLTTEHQQFKSTEQLSIYNAIGEKVYAKNGKQLMNTTAIDLSDQPNGLYFLQLKTENSIITKKIVINK